MIKPDEIKKQAEKWWKPFLQSYITGESFFPKTIDRIGKIQTSQFKDNFELLQEEVQLLYLNSKNQTGKGYTVKTTQRNFRRVGSHELPDSIAFETTEDYVQFIGKRKEWEAFLNHYDKIINTISSLKEWCYQNPQWLTERNVDWDGIIKVCQYFIATPRPNLYLRQLPVSIHTKFIEDNSPLLQSLIDFLIPEHIRNIEKKRFAERYFLKYDEPLIRIRFLDDRYLLVADILDISIPLSSFEHMEFMVENVFITENKMTFLTLPMLPSTLAIWSGGGFNISYLKDAKWLNDKNIFYWGDIDEHGFQILHQMRSYYSRVRSVMMDKMTLDEFKDYLVSGESNNASKLHLLNEKELELYMLLKNETKNRLEQEKISHQYVSKTLNSLFDNGDGK